MMLGRTGANVTYYKYCPVAALLAHACLKLNHSITTTPHPYGQAHPGLFTAPGYITNFLGTASRFVS